MAQTPAPAHDVPSTAIFATDRCYLRPLEPSDAQTLATAANDPEIAKYMRSRFPSPYTLADGEAWIARCQALSPPVMHFGIFTLDGEFAGSLGLEAPQGDSVYRGTREIGYYSVRRFWGRGILTSAVTKFVRWAFDQLHDLLRIEAHVFQGNLGSARVLVKAGFVEEGTRKCAAVKNGEVLDESFFGFTRQSL
ncbi:acetyltransferase [Xylariaceae sp. FL1019]|nr:acetyltransferase [Xylariaceae sp. FL1019]